jgi:DNA gyrase subunit A
MVVTISSQGYIKRTPANTYRAQRRGGRGITGAKSEDDDPIAHLFAASTHDYLLFFTNHGKVYWQKVYGIPQFDRDRKGRAINNLLNLAEGEKIASCLPVRDFHAPEHYLLMATSKGLIKKTALEAYGRPLKGGLIAIKLKDGDELVDVVIAKKGDEVVLSTARGMAIRFSQANARAMGRNTSGVKGINLAKDDALVGMVIADPEAMLLTVCAKGYGKRTLFGPHEAQADEEASESSESSDDSPENESATDEPHAVVMDDSVPGDDETEDSPSAQRYRTQRRGGKGVRDIKTTDRNGPVVDVVAVNDTDEILVMTKGGKLQRLAVNEIRLVGRNTQGVRIMNLEENDTVAAVVRVPSDPVTSA